MPCPARGLHCRRGSKAHNTEPSGRGLQIPLLDMTLLPLDADVAAEPAAKAAKTKKLDVKDTGHVEDEDGKVQALCAVLVFSLAYMH